MKKDDIFVKNYPANGDEITLVEHDGKPWILWSTFVGKKCFGSLPPVASLSSMADAADLVLGVDFLKAPTPRTDGKIFKLWLASSEAIAKILMARDHETAHTIFKDIGLAFVSFAHEIRENKSLLASGESDTATSPSNSPQVDEQEPVDDSPEQEVAEMSIKDLSDKMDESMDALVAAMNNAIQGLSKRIDDLEMVKYADQLSDISGRMSQLEEKIYEYKGDLADFRLVVRSLKEATGSQVQAETIQSLVKMVDESRSV